MTTTPGCIVALTWARAKNAPQVPMVHVSYESYGRIYRMAERKVPVMLELDEPVAPLFVLGGIGVAWDQGSDRVVLSLEEVVATDEEGNPELKMTSVANYDARWEWFPRPENCSCATGWSSAASPWRSPLRGSGRGW